MSDNREKFEAAVVERLKQSGFLEIEIRTECLVRCDDGYQDEVINAGWHYWNAALVATGKATSAPMLMLGMSAEELAELQVTVRNSTPGELTVATPPPQTPGPTAWAVLDMDGGAFHSVHIFKEDAERNAFGLGSVVPVTPPPSSHVAGDDAFNDEALTKQIAEFLLDRDQQTTQDERDQGEREGSAFFIAQMVRRHVCVALATPEGQP